MSEKNYPDTPRAYVDLDGVLADFIRACAERAMHPDEAKLERGLYRSLAVLPGAKEGISSLLAQGWTVFILSKIPDKNPYAATEKILWLNEHFPELKERIILSPDKGAVGRKQDFLIDDHPQWANAHRFAGTVLHFGPEGRFAGWPQVIEHLARFAPNQVTPA